MKGAGILPTAIKNGERYYLMGRESLKIKFSETGMYSEFGGGVDINESYLDCAIREGFEENYWYIGKYKLYRLSN